VEADPLYTLCLSKSIEDKRLTLVGRDHISADHLMFVVAQLSRLRHLVVSKVPNIDPAVCLTRLIDEHAPRMTVDSFCIPTRQNPRRVQPEGLAYRDPRPQYESL
jgi:hypothetical protein